MRGTLTEIDKLQDFFAKHGVDKEHMSTIQFDGFHVVSSDIHDSLDGYVVYRDGAPDIFVQFDRLDCSVDRPADYYRDFYIGDCKRPREAKQLVDGLYEIASMDHK